MKQVKIALSQEYGNANWFEIQGVMKREGDRKKKGGRTVKEVGKAFTGVDKELK